MQSTSYAHYDSHAVQPTVSRDIFNDIVSSLARRLRFIENFQHLIPYDQEMSSEVINCVELANSMIVEHMVHRPVVGLIRSDLVEGHYLVDQHSFDNITYLISPPPRRDSVNSSEADFDQNISAPFRSSLKANRCFSDYYEMGSPIADRGQRKGYHINFKLEETGLDLSAGTQELVEHFNHHPEQRSILRELFKEKIENHYVNFWESQNGVLIRVLSQEAATAREMMLAFFSCEDPDIKEFSLKALIDLLEGDPITGHSSANLVRLQECLYEFLASGSMQNLTISLQRLLTKAFALTLELILIHTGTTLNALEHDLKTSLWDRAAGLKDLNIAHDLEIDFWSSYAVEAAQRIRTDRSLIDNILQRLAKVSCATFLTAQTVFNKSATPETVYQIFSELKGALSHIPWNQRWFETLFAIKQLCYVARYSSDEFADIVKIVQDLKDSESSPCDERVFVGVISALEGVLLHSINHNILENGLKLLIQLAGFYSVQIKKRVVICFLSLFKSERNVLKVTVYQILEILHVHTDEALKEMIEREDHLIGIKEKELSTIKLDPSEKRLTQNVLKYLIRDLGNIRTESQELNRGVAATLMLCDMVEDSYKGDSSFISLLLKRVYRLQPSAFVPDAKGCNLLHVAILNRNNLILPLIEHENYGIDINAQNHEGDTPLSLAVKKDLASAIAPLARMGSNPNLIDGEGNAFLHLLALHLCSEGKVLEVLNSLKEREITFQEPLHLNLLNHLGDTPLMIALKNKNLLKALCFIDLGADLFVLNTDGKRPIDLILTYNWTQLLNHAIDKDPDIIKPRIVQKNGGTPPPSLILLAASLNAEVALIDLISKRGDSLLSEEEIFGIIQMVLSHLDRLDLIHSFLEFHLEQCQKSHAYKQQFESFHYAIQKKSRTRSRDEDDPSALVSQNFEYILVCPKGNTLTRERMRQLYTQENDSLSPQEVTSFTQQRQYFNITEIMICCCQQRSFETITPRPSEETYHASTIFGVNALTYAVQARNLEAISHLLTHSVTYLWPQTVSPIGQTCAFQIACQNLDVEILTILLEDAKQKQTNIAALDAYGRPCWLYAFGLSDQGQLNFQDYFSDRISPSHSPTDEGHPWNQSQEALDVILDALEELYESCAIGHSGHTYRDPSGRNLLHLACLYNHKESIPVILKRYPDLFWETDLIDDENGRTPLEVARDLQRFPIVRLLVCSMAMMITENKEPDLRTLDRLLSHFRPDLSLKTLLTLDHSLTDLFLMLYQQSWNVESIALPNAKQQVSFASLPRQLIDRNRMSFDQVIEEQQDPFHPSSLNVGLTAEFSEDLLTARKESPLHIAAKEGLKEIFSTSYYDPRLLLFQNIEGNTPLHLAALEGNHYCVREILYRCSHQSSSFISSLINQVNDQNQTALHLAASSNTVGHNESFLTLLEQGADPLALDGEGNNVAHYVCKSGSEGVLTLLLSYCSEPQKAWQVLRPKAIRRLNKDLLLQRLFGALNDNQRPPAMIATINGNIQQLKLLENTLIHEGTKNQQEISYYNAKDLFGYDHVRLAAQAGQITILKYLVNQAHLPYRNVCLLWETSLHAAVYNNHYECVEFLLDHDGGTNHTQERYLVHQRNIQGRTPAHEVWNRNPSYHGQGTHFMLHQVDVESDQSDMPPLPTMQTQLSGTTEQIAQKKLIIKKLIASGASFSKQDNHGRTPWHLMCRYDFSQHFTEISSLFSNKKLSHMLAIKDLSGSDPSHVAAKHNQPKMLQILHLRGNGLNNKDHVGHTPALLAALNNSFEVLHFLLEKRVDFSATLRPKSHGYNPNGKEATLLTVLLDSDRSYEEIIPIFRAVRTQHTKLLYTVLKDRSTIFHHIAMRGDERFLDETLPYMENSTVTKGLLTRANSQKRTPLDICQEKGNNSMRFKMENYDRIGEHYIRRKTIYFPLFSSHKEEAI